MEANSEQHKEEAEQPEEKNSQEEEDDDEKEEIKVDPNYVVLSEDEKARAREKFDMEDIDYDGQIDEQQCIKLLVGAS